MKCAFRSALGRPSGFLLVTITSTTILSYCERTVNISQAWLRSLCEPHSPILDTVSKIL